MKKIIGLLCVLCMLCGCSQKGNQIDDTETPTQTTDMFTDRDYRTTYEDEIEIVLSEDSIQCDSTNVSIQNTTLTIQKEGVYILSGTLNDGMVIVDVNNKDKVQLVLNNVSINSNTSSPLYILEGDKVFVTLMEETKNTLSNGGEFISIDDKNIDGVIFSKQDLTLNGKGELIVESPNGHGIVCKDDLVFTGGSYTINTSGHGLDANDSVRIDQSNFTISSGKDGIHVENTEDETKGFIYIENGTFDITSEGDGFDASLSIDIKDGEFDVLSGGGSVNATKQTSDNWGGFMGGRNPKPSQTLVEESDSTSIKGIKAGSNLNIYQGTFTIDSADDAIHSNTSVYINDGTFEISTGDDAIHAEDNLNIQSGNINILESYEGIEGYHIDISGGKIQLVASDDGLNAAGGVDQSGFGGPRGNDKGMMSSNSEGSIEISGGDLYINASGDGIDANGYLLITGGYTVVVGPTRGDTATLDYDTYASIEGGTFIGTGAQGMAQTFNKSTQGVFTISVGNAAANTKITLEDKQGNVLVSYTPELAYGLIIISTEDMKSGETYKITVGSQSGEFEAN